MIVSTELAPGAVVDERELSARFGIGRTPMREAIRRLAREKLIEVYPRRGMFVTTVELRDLASLSEVRLALEPLAARLAARRATDAEREELRMLTDELLDVHEPDERQLIELDERIHKTLYRCAHNPFLEATLDEYYALAKRIWFLALDRTQGLEEAVLTHHNLLLAIFDGRAEDSEKIMRGHVQDFERAMRKALGV